MSVKKYIFINNRGGMGKTTVLINTAYILSTAFEKKVGILDLSINTPMIPFMLGVHSRNFSIDKDKILPVKVLNNLFVASNEFFVEKKSKPIVKRDYINKLIIEQLIKDIDWSNFDILLIDTPSDFSDEILYGIENLKSIDGGIIITTPQNNSIIPLKRTLNFLKQYRIEFRGIVVNMHKYQNNETIPLFEREGFNDYIKRKNLNIIVEIPFNREILRSADNGVPYTQKFDEKDAKLFYKIAKEILNDK